MSVVNITLGDLECFAVQQYNLPWTQTFKPKLFVKHILLNTDYTYYNDMTEVNMLDDLNNHYSPYATF